MIYSAVKSLYSLVLPSDGPWDKLSHLPPISLQVRPNKTALCPKYRWVYTLIHITTEGNLLDTEQTKYKPITICQHLWHFKLSWKHI